MSLLFYRVFFRSKTLLKIKYIELKITASNDMADLF